MVIKSEKSDIAANTDSFGRWLVKITIDGTNICDVYNHLGINKNFNTYSEDNVLNLKRWLEEE